MSDYITAQQIIRLICRQILDTFRSFRAGMSKPRPRGLQSYRFFRPTSRNHFPICLGDSFVLPGRTENLAGIMTLEAWVQTPLHLHFNPVSKEKLDLLEVSCKRLQDKQTWICKIRPERKMHFLCHLSILLLPIHT